jgi:hypothetical protein
LDKVFYFYATSKSFFSAREVCQSQTGDLATIISQAEYDLLVSTLPYNSIGIGWNDIAKEGDWGWADGTPVNSSFVKWVANEPNGGTGSNCGHILLRSGYDDVNCNNARFFLCSRVSTSMYDFFF